MTKAQKEAAAKAAAEAEAQAAAEQPSQEEEKQEDPAPEPEPEAEVKKYIVCTCFQSGEDRFYPGDKIGFIDPAHAANWIENGLIKEA